MSKDDLVKMLDIHVDGVRHYLHLQIGKPMSKDLISAPEIALDNLHREVKAAILDESHAQHPTGHPVAWRWKRHAGERDWLVTDVKPFPREGRLIEPLYTASLTPAACECSKYPNIQALLVAREEEIDRLHAQVADLRSKLERANSPVWDTAALHGRPK